MKILLIIAVIVILGIVGLVLLFRAGVSTRETVVAQFTDGNDRLILQHTYTSDWGNSYYVRQLLWNDRQVDFRGSMMYRQNEGRKTFPVHPDDVRQLRVDVLADSNAYLFEKTELIRRKVAYLEDAVEFQQLKAVMPELSELNPWTVWVNPKDFSAGEYERIKDLLRKGHETLLEQQRNYVADSTKSKHDWATENPLVIWRTVYFDYAKLKNREFKRETAGAKQTVLIGVGGDVQINHQSDRYVAGFGCALGQVSDNGDTLAIDKNWPTTEIYFPVSELSEFKDAQGRALTEQYQVAVESASREKQ